MTISEYFGQILKDYRKNLHISQEELAHKSNLDRTFISLLERGKRNATIDTLFRISESLNIKPSEFIKKIENLADDNIKL